MVMGIVVPATKLPTLVAGLALLNTKPVSANVIEHAVPPLVLTQLLELAVARLVVADKVAVPATLCCTLALLLMPFVRLNGWPPGCVMTWALVL